MPTPERCIFKQISTIWHHKFRSGQPSRNISESTQFNNSPFVSLAEPLFPLVSITESLTPIEDISEFIKNRYGYQTENFKTTLGYFTWITPSSLEKRDSIVSLPVPEYADLFIKKFSGLLEEVILKPVNIHDNPKGDPKILRIYGPYPEINLSIVNQAVSDIINQLNTDQSRYVMTAALNIREIGYFNVREDEYMVSVKQGKYNFEVNNLKESNETYYESGLSDVAKLNMRQNSPLCILIVLPDVRDLDRNRYFTPPLSDHDDDPPYSKEFTRYLTQFQNTAHKYLNCYDMPPQIVVIELGSQPIECIDNELLVTQDYPPGSGKNIPNSFYVGIPPLNHAEARDTYLPEKWRGCQSYVDITQSIALDSPKWNRILLEAMLVTIKTYPEIQLALEFPGNHEFSREMIQNWLLNAANMLFKHLENKTDTTNPWQISQAIAIAATAGEDGVLPEKWMEMLNKFGSKIWDRLKGLLGSQLQPECSWVYKKLDSFSTTGDERKKYYEWEQEVKAIDASLPPDTIFYSSIYIPAVNPYAVRLAKVLNDTNWRFPLNSEELPPPEHFVPVCEFCGNQLSPDLVDWDKKSHAYIFHDVGCKCPGCAQRSIILIEQKGYTHLTQLCPSVNSGS
jgi:hypothetical protein